MEELMETVAETTAVCEPEGTSSACDDTMDPKLLSEAECLRESYPDFDLEAQMKDPLFKGLVSGEIRPDPRQVFELCHKGEITKKKVEEAVAEAVAAAVEAAVTEAVSRTVTETEKRMLSQIRARGQRPAESGLSAALGVRTHLAVGRLTKADRERLARRASRGETVRL